MKTNILLFFLLIVAAKSFGADSPYIFNQQRFVRIQPLYQAWSGENNATFTETSIPFYAYIPISRVLSFNLQTSQATASGDYLQEISGLTDMQLGVNYFFESLNLVANLGVNVPSGKKELTPTEFLTSSLLSYNYFNFLVPNFGQGLNVSAGVTWAYPVNDQLVLGAGASYQYKGKFKPLQGMLLEFEPGDEILFTGGADYRLNEVSSLSADLIYIMYSPDKIGSYEVFESGDMLIANIQYRRYFDFHELWLNARYRSKGKNSLPIAGSLEPEPQKSTPDQIELIARYRYRVNPQLYISALVEGRFFKQTSVFTAVNVLGLGVAPEYALSPAVTIPIQLKLLRALFENGSNMSGWEIGLGIRYSF